MSLHLPSISTYLSPSLWEEEGHEQAWWQKSRQLISFSYLLGFLGPVSSLCGRMRLHLKAACGSHLFFDAYLPTDEETGQAEGLHQPVLFLCVCMS